MEVFITGFGPFTGHPINPSWLVVRHLPDRISINGGEIARLRKHQLPVDYRFIDRLYNNNNNNNHKDHVISAQTTLIVHVGVSGVAEEMLLERQAFNQSKGKDISGYQPPHGRVITTHTQSNILYCPLGKLNYGKCIRGTTITQT
jgi:pyroglutamyl-peptidase